MRFTPSLTLMIFLLSFSCQANEETGDSVASRKDSQDVAPPKCLYDLSIEHVEFGLSRDSLILIYFSNTFDEAFEDEFRLDIIGPDNETVRIDLDIEKVENPMVFSAEDFPDNDFEQLLKMSDLGIPPHLILIWSSYFNERAVLSVADGIVSLGWYEFNSFDKIDQMDLSTNYDKEFYLRLKSLENYDGKIDTQGLKQGTFEWKYQNGSVRAVAKFEDDKLIILDHYDIRGKLRTSIDYDEDKEDYLKSEYNMDGVLVYKNYMSQ